MACFSSDVKGTGQEACWSVECAHCVVLFAHCPACLPTCTGQLPVKQRGAAAAASGGNLELSEFEESDSEKRMTLNRKISQIWWRARRALMTSICLLLPLLRAWALSTCGVEQWLGLFAGLHFIYRTLIFALFDSLGVCIRIVT